MNIECRVLCVSFIPEEFRVLVKDAVNDIGLVRKVLSMVGTIDVVDSTILHSLNGKSKLSLKDARVLFESVERAFSILGFGYNFEQAIKSSDDSGKGYYTLFETTYRNSRKLYCYPLNDNDRKTESRERSYRIYTLLKCLAVYSYCVNAGVQPTIHHLELVDQYIYFYLLLCQ